MRAVRTSAVLLTISLLLPIGLGAAGVFSDVADQHPFREAIEGLNRIGVVKGNPDGTFRPEDMVNRAAFLTMLYRLSGRQPRAVESGCFRDVERGSWYEAVVCDAASSAHRFVQGYADGTFRPSNPVSRTEALKMIMTVMNLPVPAVTSADQEIIKFTDLSVSAWYSTYVSSAYKLGILPIATINGARFFPDQSVKRGEASGLLWNTTHAISRTESSQGLSSIASSSTTSSVSSSTSNDLKDVRFPFNDTDTFTSRQPKAYIFSLTAPKTIVSITAETTGQAPSSLTCRLYLLGNDAFSTEYYLGVQEGNRCRLVAAVRPGRYQLQVQPDRAGVPYFVNAASSSTDGNDGFMDAVSLVSGTPVSGTLDGANDLMDWYSFTVSGEREGTVFASASSKLTCSVYAPSDVDLFGFKGPECGLQYRYPSGTYIVGVGRPHGSALSASTPYTIQWR